MNKIKFMSALLCGAMAVTMCPLALSADTDSIQLNAATFPDPAFRNYLSQHFDRNHDDVLSAQEIDDVRQIKASELGITDLTGIKLFPRLRTLWANENELTALDLSGTTSLQEVMIRNNHITSVNVSGMTSLQRLDLGHNELSSIDVSGLDNLDSLGLEYNNFTSFDARGLDLKVISMDENPNLRSFQVDGARVETVSLSNCSKITSLDVSGCPALLRLYIQGISITELDLSANAAFAENLSTCECKVEDLFEDYDYIEYFRRDEEESNLSYIQFMYMPDVRITWPSDAPAVPTPTVDPDNPATYPVLDPVEIPDEPGVGGFVERLYAVALGRPSDPTGKENWINAITSGSNTGADAARGFLLSSEFLNSDMDTNEFVYVLYRTFFGREPDRDGRIAWIEAINGGASREEVINGFVNSTEFANLCLSYGVVSGGTGVPNIDVEPNQATIDFATRLYTTCLGRDADEAGLMAWARQLANQRDTGTGAARGFFFSSEFTNQNVSNAEYVNRLYRTFMGREADDAGFNAWVAQLDAGVSREEVFNGFSQSTEFGVICAQYGIIKG